jgi:crotonobetainyl-CoA:carnitine CoA-transferase CaiB-like acyl-CoA transferase
MTMTNRVSPKGLLGPYRVLDLTTETGSYCGYLLGGLGADVIRVEPPGGCAERHVGPFLNGQPALECGFQWLSYNIGKRSITANLETSKGRALLQRLLESADVLVESYPPGYLQSFGIDFESMKNKYPRLIWTSITPYGQSGPKSSYMASDLTCWAAGGLLFQTGEPDSPPVRVGHINFAYLLGCMDAAWGAALAIFHRSRTGAGQLVDVSIQASVAKTNFISHETWEITGREQTRVGPFWTVHGSEVKLRQVWETKDGHIAFMIFGGHWGATHDNPPMVSWLDDEGFADEYLRTVDWANLNWRKTPLGEVAKIHGYFERFFKSKTKKELLEGALKRRVSLQPINGPADILEHPQLRARNYFRPLPTFGQGRDFVYPSRFCLPTNPVEGLRPAPRLGEHNYEIYIGEMGLTQTEFTQLKMEMVI